MAKTSNSYLDIEGLTTLVGKYITGKTGSTYTRPENELVTKVDFIALSTQENQTLAYGYTYKTGSSSTKQVIIGTITITGALTDKYLSSADLSTDGKLSLYVSTNGNLSSNAAGDLVNGAPLDLTKFVNPDDYIKSLVMSSDYITPSVMGTTYFTIASANTLISINDMNNNRTILSSDITSLFD